LKRIGEEYKQEFMEKFSKDFLKAIEDGEFSCEILSAEEQLVLRALLRRDYANIYQLMFFDVETTEKLHSSQKLVIYGDENKTREICKRLDDYKLANLQILGVALNNGRNQGMVWNQHIFALEQLTNNKGVTVFLATDNNIEETKKMLESSGCSRFIDMPKYIEGIN
jgi:hypothetical protein